MSELSGRGQVLIDGQPVAMVDYWIEKELRFNATPAFGNEGEILPTVGEKIGRLQIVEEEPASATYALIVAQSFVLLGEQGSHYRCTLDSQLDHTPGTIGFRW